MNTLTINVMEDSSSLVSTQLHQQNCEEDKYQEITAPDNDLRGEGEGGRGREEG